MKTDCPLCSTENEIFFQEQEIYYKCSVCFGIYADEENKLDLASEKKRYELHDDDTADAGYRKFANPIVSSILDDYKSTDKGLDFGAGTSAIISVILKEHNYDIKNYDPYFHIYPKLLEQKYDYISSCEVIEHFYIPYKEFKLLKSLLKENSKIYLMSELYNEETDFSSWYYKNDPTHVFFYSNKTFQWIKNEFGFKSVKIDKRLIVLSN